MDNEELLYVANQVYMLDTEIEKAIEKQNEIDKLIKDMIDLNEYYLSLITIEITTEIYNHIIEEIDKNNKAIGALKELNKIFIEKECYNEEHIQKYENETNLPREFYLTFYEKHIIK